MILVAERDGDAVGYAAFYPGDAARRRAPSRGGHAARRARHGSRASRSSSTRFAQAHARRLRDRRARLARRPTCSPPASGRNAGSGRRICVCAETSSRPLDAASPDPVRLPDRGRERGRRRRAAAAPPLGGRRRRRRGRPRRAPLPALRLAARGARLARRHRDARRRGAGAAAARSARRSPPLRARGHDRRARAAGSPDDAPDDSRRRRAQPAGRSPRARGLLAPSFARHFHGRVAVHDAEAPDLVHVGDAGRTPLRVNPLLARDRPRPPRHRRRDRAPRRAGRPARRLRPRGAARRDAPTRCSRPPRRAAGSSASRSSGRWPAACR